MEIKQRKDIVEYEDAPSGAIKLYNYKEPFMPVEKGYGFMGVLMHDAEEQLIQCHLCGKWFRTLNNHIATHGFANASHYKNEYGLSQSTALLCEDMRNRFIEVGKESIKIFKGKIPGGGFKKGNGREAGSSKSLEKRNNRGTCPLQLLDKLDKIKNQIGHVPSFTEVHTLKELKGNKFSGAGLTRSLDYVYGSWDNAVSQLHWTGVNKLKKHVYTRQSLKESFKDFVKKNKRFPSESDCRRGTFPSKTVFNKHFGSIRKLKEEFMEEIIKVI